jgi:hypothetical protein
LDKIVSVFRLSAFIEQAISEPKSIHDLIKSNKSSGRKCVTDKFDLNSKRCSIPPVKSVKAFTGNPPPKFV